MVLFFRNLIIFVLMLSFLGCESKKSYNISSDPMLNDLNSRITTMQGEMDTLSKEMKKITTLLKNEGDDLDFELKASLKKELLEGGVHEKSISQWLSYLKIQAKQRHKSLYSRKGKESLSENAEIESNEYFIQKKLKPIAKPWLTRYRTAIEL